MKILAIRFARLGDVLLLLPALAALKEKFPDSRLVFLTGHRCAPIAEMCPFIDEVIAVDRIAMRDGPIWTAIARMARLTRDVRRRRFDIVIDFHSFRETNLLAWISGAPFRLGMKRYGTAYWGFCFNQPPVEEDKSLHVSEMFMKIVDRIPAAGNPQMHPAQWRPVLKVSGAIYQNQRLVLYVDAPVQDRIWPPERFAQLADLAIERWNADVLVIASPEQSIRAETVRRASHYADRLTVKTDLSLPQLVREIASARLLVSNDTGPMHIGPAVGVPTLGLFSVGYPEHFRPLGANHRYLRANPIEKIDVTDVMANAEEMWAIAGPDLQR